MVAVAVVGAGIAGLAAAHRLRVLTPDVHVTVYEAGDRVGGVLRTVELAGTAYDVGAEAFLARRPELPTLLGELGLSAHVEHPSAAAPSVLAGARVCSLPARTVLGVPTDAASLRGLVGDATVAQVATEGIRPFSWEVGADPSVGELVRTRLGAEVVARSVDPLLGGVYSGSADSIGLRAAIPALAAALDAGAPGLLAAARRARPAPRPGAPVFGALRGGYRVLLDALASTTDVRLRAPVTALRRAGNRLVLAVDGVDQPPVDAVILAVGAPVLRRLLTGVAPAGSALLRDVEPASVAVVGLAYPAGTAGLPVTSGLLVATGEAVHAKAFTHSGVKWPHLRTGPVLVRASLGRHGHAQVLERDDHELVGLVRADLEAIHGLRAVPSDTVVQRWPDGLPQYGPGHPDRVAALERAVGAVPGLELAGSLLHGVGVPACVGSGRGAAERVVARLPDGAPAPG